MAKEYIAKIQVADKIVIATFDSDCITSSNQSISNISPCNHEEADTRMLIHVQDGVRDSNTSIMIKTVDTDVVVISITMFPDLKDYGCSELWISFGVGTKLRHLPVHEISNSLGILSSKSLSLMHAFSGCDTVSSFCGIGKKTCLDVFLSFPQIIELFCSILNNLPEAESIISENFSIIERYIILYYLVIYT